MHHKNDYHYAFNKLITIRMKRINQFGHFVLSEIKLTRLTKINEQIML